MKLTTAASRFRLEEGIIVAHPSARAALATSRVRWSMPWPRGAWWWRGESLGRVQPGKPTTLRSSETSPDQESRDFIIRRGQTDSQWPAVCAVGARPGRGGLCAAGLDCENRL